jgi:hypothetical protein
MAYRDEATDALETARKALRDIMTEAVAAEAFAEVSLIAGVAEALAAITGDLRSADTPMTPVEPHRKVRDRESGRPVASLTDERSHTERLSTGPHRQSYPQYFREVDRLVKRAWSKKERQPYEHKAPREIIPILLEAMRKRHGDRTPFEATDIMPLYRGNGEEFPSYQSYLALGWLRHAGAIGKGRQGYMLRSGWDEGRIAQLWDALPLVA